MANEDTVPRALFEQALAHLGQALNMQDMLAMPCEYTEQMCIEAEQFIKDYKKGNDG